MPCPKPFRINKLPDQNMNPPDPSTEISLARASALLFKAPHKSTFGTQWVPADRASTGTGMKTEPQQCHCHGPWAHSSACSLYLPCTSSFRQVSKCPAAQQPPADQGHPEPSVPVPGRAQGTAHPLPWPCSCAMLTCALGQHSCKAAEQRG